MITRLTQSVSYPLAFLSPLFERDGDLRTRLQGEGQQNLADAPRPSGAEGLGEGLTDILQGDGAHPREDCSWLRRRFSSRFRV